MYTVNGLPDTIAECEEEIARAERIAAIAEGVGNSDARITYRNWRASLVNHKRRLMHERFGIGLTQNAGMGAGYAEPVESIGVVRR